MSSGDSGGPEVVVGLLAGRVALVALLRTAGVAGGSWAPELECFHWVAGVLEDVPWKGWGAEVVVVVELRKPVGSWGSCCSCLSASSNSLRSLLCPRYSCPLVGVSRHGRLGGYFV